MDKLHHELWIVQIVNTIFGPIVAAAMQALGMHVEPGARLIPDHVVMSALIVLFVLGLGLAVRSRLRVENPGRLQIVLEEIVGLFLQLLRTNIGEKGPRFLPLVGGIGVFIFIANQLGKIPGLMSPTASLNTTVGCALTVWIYYHYQGIRAQGIGAYVKHFAAPPGAPIFIAPIMFPIEIISHLSRVMSLSLRLFGNIFGEEMVVLILASIIPFVVPLPMMVLGLITGTLQAFIFMLLTMIYLAGAVHTEHEHEAEHGHGHDEAPARAAA
jgi:F-type H+-transporting ATPase subunit a